MSFTQEMIDLIEISRTLTTDVETLLKDINDRIRVHLNEVDFASIIQSLFATGRVPINIDPEVLKNLLIMLIDTGKLGPNAITLSGKTLSELVLKTELGAAALREVNVNGLASPEQVVLGSDTRLSDARIPLSHVHGASDLTSILSNATPLQNGSVGVVGVDVFASRSDHVHPVQTSVTGNAGTATKLQIPRSINGVAFDGSANITINAVDSTSRVASSLIGATNGVAPLGADGKISTYYMPSSVIGGMVYKGSWDAKNNIPPLPAANSTNQGWMYYVGVAGETNVDGIKSWTVGDQVVSSGSRWDRVGSGVTVTTVFGRVGNITLLNTDIALASTDTIYDQGVLS